ncbi:hypothetical protein Tco_0779094 [Tanacetum coccineum]
MAGLTFADSHNMVAYLEKSMENADFAEIVDFLNANPIRVFVKHRKKGKEKTFFSGTITPLFETMLIQHQAKVGEGSGQPTDLQHTSTTATPSQVEPIIVPSSSQPKRHSNCTKGCPPTATSLDVEQDSGNINRTQSTIMPNDHLPKRIGSGGRPRRQETTRDIPAQTRFESLSKQSNDLPLSRVNTLGSGEDIMKLKEFMEQLEIASLKKRVKKLEKRKRSRTPGMTLFKIGETEVNLEESDVDEDLDNAVMDEAIEHVYEADKDVEGDAEQVSAAAVDVSTVTAAGVSVSTAEPTTPPTTTTTTIFEDKDLTIAQTLLKMKIEKSKVRGVVMKEPNKTATRLTIPPQQHDPKDKGKAKMVEQENPLKKKDQIKFDEEVAQRLQVQLQAELEEEERLAKLQAKEQGELTIEERSRLFVELMDKRKKHFARLRAEEQRRKPLTKAQKRNQMCTYLKNMAGFTHNHETRGEGSSKRAGDGLQQESTKKKKVDDDDKEKEDLKQCFEIVPAEEVVINAIPLATKPAPIVDFQIHTKGKQGYYEIIRADGSSKIYLVFSQLFKEFDRKIWNTFE